jgi:hypothetical protein
LDFVYKVGIRVGDKTTYYTIPKWHLVMEFIQAQAEFADHISIAKKKVFKLSE